MSSDKVPQDNQDESKPKRHGPPVERSDSNAWTAEHNLPIEQ